MPTNDIHKGHTPRAIRATQVRANGYVCEYVYEGEEDFTNPDEFRPFIPGRQITGIHTDRKMQEIASNRRLPLLVRETRR